MSRPALGDRVEDAISGYAGIVTAITNWLYGCRRITIQSEGLKDGKPGESYTIDEPQVKVIKAKVIVGQHLGVGAPRHGPRPDIPRHPDPVR